MPAALLCLGVGAAVAAGRPPQPEFPTCSEALEGLEGLFHANNPDFLAWDMEVYGCDSEQLHRAYYFQGLGFHFLGEHQRALLHLSLALDLGGPFEEELEDYIADIMGLLDISPERERLGGEMGTRYPLSVFLDEKATADNAPMPGTLAFTYSTSFYRSHSRYFNNLWYQRLSGSLEQASGPHRFQETVGFYLLSRAPGNWLDGWQAYMKGRYLYKAFTLEGDLGLTYDNPAGWAEGLDSTLATTWTLGQGRLNLQGLIHPLRPWYVSLGAHALRYRPGWTAAGLSHSQLVLLRAATLSAYASLDRHWMDFAAPPPETLTLEDGTPTTVRPPATHGFYSATAGISISPDFAESHDISLGIEYAFESEVLGEQYPPGFIGAEKSHAYSASTGYDWRPRPWLKLSLSLEGGYEFRTVSRDRPIHRLMVGASSNF